MLASEWPHPPTTRERVFGLGWRVAMAPSSDYLRLIPRPQDPEEPKKVRDPGLGAEGSLRP
jgi:hypothetical protein